MEAMVLIHDVTKRVRLHMISLSWEAITKIPHPMCIKTVVCWGLDFITYARTQIISVSSSILELDTPANCNIRANKLSMRLSILLTNY